AMDAANSRLESGPEPLRHNVREPPARTQERCDLTSSRPRDTEKFTGPLAANMLVSQIPMVLTLNPNDFRRYSGIMVFTPEEYLKAGPPWLTAR
ncbi:MAG TPA: hypothetical protein VFW87_15050, partial [Pirellulales bacterium]|nr:hypothetical protein [Pirellulales bacterium]